MLMAIPIMAHLVLGYPTLEQSIRTAETYIEAGCAILELQIPFSHPTADGSVITRACRVAVEEQHVQVSDCFAAIQTLRLRYPEQEMMVMTYLNRMYAYGVKPFYEALQALRIRHLIVPDLPVRPQLEGPLRELEATALSTGVKLVPVLAANVSVARLEQLLAAGFDCFYLMSDFKITGSRFSLHPRLTDITRYIRQRQPDARVGIGFGIQSPEQVQAVLEVADCAIIGSALIEAQEAGNLVNYLHTVLKPLNGHKAPSLGGMPW